ncbi:S-crystallin SL11 [Holothuria leucospilota]|uniref:S-crystallin SL11 n=1 Tax=Holothuria leucospilota TaxID=206669 RepID=A0A9Q1BBQ7_HOLLE|nr:S-crystallin SL11 [Holothuria leucospilota]
MPSSYKLIYFDRKGRAEPMRFLFVLAGVKFEDKRLALGGDEWKAMKPKTGLGALPVLVVDGKEIPQSTAILRYVGGELGFIPKNLLEVADMDVVLETINDLRPSMRPIFFEQDATKKAEMSKHFLAEGCQPPFNNLEKLLKQNKGGKGFFVGDKMTLADVVIFSLMYDGISGLTGMEAGDLSYLRGQPLIKAFVERFKTEPTLADWLKKRPKTSF